MAVNNYEAKGVMLGKKTLHSGDTVTLNYNGLLAQSGACSIVAHLGYGDEWENEADVPMQLVDGVFSTEIDIQSGKKLGICFRDSASNWDNNSGENYIFKITAKRAKK